MWYRRQEEKPAAPRPGAPEPALPHRAIAEAPAEPPRPTASRVGRGLRIKGEIEGREDLRVDGLIEGSVRLPGGQMTVGEHGAVSGPIDAREIVVHGAVRGRLSATDRIEISATGTLQGDIAAQRLRIEEGARVRGRVAMGSEEDSRKRRGRDPHKNDTALFSIPQAKTPASEQ